MKTCLLLICILLTIGTSLAQKPEIDTLITFNGQKFIGEILQHSRREVVIKLEEGRIITVSPYDIKSFNGTVLENMNIPDSQTPGNELIKTWKHYYIGIAILMAGTAVATISAVSYKADINDSENEVTHKKNTRDAFLIAGGSMVLLGCVLQIEAFSHLGKAGKLLNMNIGREGVGVNIKF